MIEYEQEHFHCKYCNDVVYIGHYDYKDANIYQALKERLNCESCVKDLAYIKEMQELRGKN